MKKKVLSLLFACIMILSVLAISGCKSDELQAQIDENATKAETAVTDAAAKAETDLAAAKAELEALIAAGDAADAKDLADAVAKLNSAIDAAKAAATTADDALKADLTAAIATAKKEAADGASAALDAAVKKLNDAVALKVDATAYNKAVADLDAAVAAAKKTASDADAALETKLTAAIATAKADAVADAKTYVDDKVAELVAADKTSTDAFNKAIADVNAGIDAAEKLAADADAALKTALETAIADAKVAAVTYAEEYVNEQIAKFKDELAKADDTDKAALAVKIQTLTDNIAAAEAAAKAAATTADEALKAELNAKIAELEAAIAYGDKATADAWGDWNDATAVVIEKLYKLELAYTTFMNATYSKPDAVVLKAIEIYTETKTKLLRAVNVDAVNAEYQLAGDFFTTIIEVHELYNGYNKSYYYDEQLKELNDLLAAALLEIAATDENIPAIKTALKADMDEVMTKDEALLNMLEADGTPVKAVTLGEKWTKLLAFVNEKINTEDEEIYKALNFDAVKATYDEYQLRYNVLVELKAAADLYNLEFKKLADLLSEDNKYNATFNKDNVELYKLFEEKVAVWYENLGETNEENMKLLDAAVLETMRANYSARKKGLEDYAAKMLSDLKKFSAADYVYLYSEELEKEVFALYDNFPAFKGYAKKIGYGDELAKVEEYHVAFNAFEVGTYARALALHDAAAEAEGINKAVEDLTKILDHLTTFKTEYQDKMEAIDLAVEAWKKAYFTEHYAAEAVAGNVNYELLKHAAYADLQDLYAEKLGAIEKAMQKVTETFNAEGFKTINLLSKDEIDAAKDAWNELIELVADLGLNTKEITVGHIDLINGEATTDQIADLIDTQTLAFKAACEAAYKDYKLLNHPVLDATLVTIYDEKSVAQMVDWYDKYLGIDPSDAASVLPADGVDLVLSEADKVVMTVELYDAAKATYTAWKTLSDAKKAEMDKLIADIAAFVNGTINTERRAAYNALKERLDAFLEGDGAIALGYKKSQYNIDPENDTYVVDDSKLAEAGKKIKDLEQKRKALFDRIDALATEAGRNDLLDATKETANKALLDTLKADMVEFTAENAGFNCFVESEGTEYTNREVIIDQSREIIEIALIYDEAITKVESIGNDAVKTDLKARALEARKAALDLILSLDPTEWADSDAYAVEKAKLEIVKNTINSYLTYAPEKGEDKMAQRYENTVKSHMAKATVDALAALELTGKGVDDLIGEISYSIDDAFAKIGTTVTP